MYDNPVRALEAKKYECIGEMERAKDAMLRELCVLDRCTLDKLRFIVADYERMEKSVIEKLNNGSVTVEAYKKYVENLIKDFNAQIPNIDPIAKQIADIGTGLDDAARELEALKSAQETLTTDFEKAVENDANRLIPAIRRKMLAITGTLRDINKEQRYARCRVNAVTDGYIDITCSGPAFMRSVRFSIETGLNTTYEITRLSGYGFQRASVYSTNSANKVLVDLSVDGVRYTDISVLKSEGLEFRSLIVNYFVTAGDKEIPVTLYVTADGVKIIEGTAGTAGLISGSYVTPIAQHGNGVMVFTMNNGARYYTETVTTGDGFTVKTFNFNGGV